MGKAVLVGWVEQFYHARGVEKGVCTFVQQR